MAFYETSERMTPPPSPGWVEKAALSHTTWLGQTLTGITFLDSSMDYLQCLNTQFVNCRFINMTFVRSDFRDTTFKNCLFHKVAFADSQFSAVTLTDCTFTISAQFLGEGAKLQNCIWWECAPADGVVLEENNLELTSKKEMVPTSESIPPAPPISSRPSALGGNSRFSELERNG